MNSLPALGLGAPAAGAIPRGVPNIGSDTLAQSSGAGANVTMYLGMEMPICISPEAIGPGVGPKEATSMGRLAARPLMKSHQASSEPKTSWSSRPTSHWMVVACDAGLAMTILPAHLGSVRSM